jgi:hypothetical protein
MPRERLAQRRTGAAARLGAVALTLVLAGCLPIPNVQVPLVVPPADYRVDPALVAIATDWWPMPPAPRTPSEFDQTGIRRTFVPGDERQVIVVAMPGLFGGAASFDPWARQLVAALDDVEVWAVDRRANQFEDRSGIRQALATGDPEVALRYYLDPVPGTAAFEPLRGAEVPFMAYWGLDTHLRDLHTVVLLARASGASTVLLAGHSLGAGVASVYAAYRVPRELGGGVGQDHVDGLVLLDGTIGRTGAFGREDRGFGAFGITVVPTVADLEAGRTSPFLTLPRGWARHVRHSVVAVYAQLDPDGSAPPALSRFPISNRALAGVMADDHYALTPVFSLSVGEALHARYSGNVTAVLLSGVEGVRSRTVIGVADGAERVEWSSGDARREFTDLDVVLAAYTDRHADFAEWYFPTRLLLDLAALDPRLEGETAFVPAVEVDLPTFGIGAGRGLIPSPSGFQSYVNTRPGAPIAVTVVPGLTHLDITMARDNPTIPILSRWMRSEGWLPPRR